MSEHNPFSIEAHREHIGKYLNEQMNEQAERLVKQSVREIERQLRAEVAKFVLSTIDQQYSVERHGTDLVITVRGFGQ
jgi:hypothetical protein